MCTVSMVLDHGRRQWPEVDKWEQLKQWPTPSFPSPNPLLPSFPTREEFDALKKMVEDAKRIDDATGQPDCEDDGKMAWFKKLEARVAIIEEAARTPALPYTQAAPGVKWPFEAVNDMLKHLDDAISVMGSVSDAVGAYSGGNLIRALDNLYDLRMALHIDLKAAQS